METLPTVNELKKAYNCWSLVYGVTADERMDTVIKSIIETKLMGHNIHSLKLSYGASTWLAKKSMKTTLRRITQVADFVHRLVQNESMEYHHNPWLAALDLDEYLSLRGVSLSQFVDKKGFLEATEELFHELHPKKDPPRAQMVSRYTTVLKQFGF